MKAFYNVELNQNKADKLKVFLKNNNIYFEPSQNYNLIHFEIEADENEANKVNEFLSKL
jgi:hypothetical protein